MATIALDIHGQGVAIQSYQNKVHQLDDVIVRHLARFRRIALRFLGNMADAEDAVQDTFLSVGTVARRLIARCSEFTKANRIRRMEYSTRLRLPRGFEGPHNES